MSIAHEPKWRLTSLHYLNEKESRETVTYGLLKVLRAF